MTHSDEQNELTEMIPEGDQMADLLDKDFKTTFLKMLKEVKEDIGS